MLKMQKLWFSKIDKEKFINVQDLEFVRSITLSAT
jgi:hypothetical protein